MTKHIAVVCNNKQEWQLFGDNLTFMLSKQGGRYKVGAESIHSLDNDITYICIPNSHYRAYNKLYLYADDSSFSLDAVVNMCKIDTAVEELLNNWR
jgi:hypothetical protein